MLNNKKFKYPEYLILVIFSVHQIFQSLKIGTYWDSIGALWTAGKFIEKSITTINDFNNPILLDFATEEFYGAFASLPIFLLMRITSSSKLSELFVDTSYFRNIFDFYFFLQYLFLTIYVVLVLFIIFNKLKKMISKKFSLLFIIFLCLYPSFNGHALFNLKDIPLSLNIFLASIYYIDYFLIKKNDKLDFKKILILSFLISSCILVRSTSFIFLLPLFLFSFFQNKIEKKSIFLSNLKIFLFSIIFFIVGTPNMWRYPTLYLSKILEYQFDTPWRGVTLTNGNYVDSIDPTISYLSVWFFYKTPIILLFFLIVNIFLFKKTRLNILNRYSFFVIFYTFTLHAIVSPLTYNGIRHYLFLIPFFTSLFVVGFIEISEKFVQLNYLLIFSTLLYLFLTQLPYDQYKYTYFNEFTSTNDMANYCKEINGCGNWLTDYWGTSGKESAELLDKYNFNHLYICSPQFATTIYMDHKKINIDNFWVFKNGLPVYNETSGFEQFKLIYSEGHFKKAIYEENIREMYVHSLYLPHKPIDTCNFYEIEDDFDIKCDFVDSVTRKVRSSNISFAFVSKCIFEEI